MRTFTLIIKEIITLLRDKQSRMVVIIPVLMQVSLFPFAATLEVTNASVGIYSEDTGKESIEVTQRIAGAKAFSKVTMFKSRTEMEHSLNNQDILLAIWFPPDFSKKIASKNHTKILAIFDGRHSNSAQITANYLNSILMEYQAELYQTAKNILPAKLEIRNWYNPNLNYKWFILPSLIALITTVGVLIFTALSIAREREQGTMDQLLVSPLTTAQIFIGKAVSALLIAMLQGTLVLLAGLFIYRIPFAGSILLLYGSIVVYCFSLVGFGLLISSICQTQQQAFIGVFLFMMPAVLLSGYIAPIENMPQWLQTITMINPIRYFTEITKQIYLKGAGFFIIWESLLPLFVIIATTGTGAYFLFRKNIS